MGFNYHWGIAYFLNSLQGNLVGFSAMDFMEIAIGSGQLKLMARCKGI